MHPLKKNLKRLLLGVVLLGITLLALFSFLPKKYDVVAFAERPGTAYLSLEDGSKIGYFRIVNTADTIGSPVIYLHGGPGGIIKDEVIQSLSPLASQGHDLYFYDQIGSGHSDRLDDISGYSVERHRQDLSKIVELTGAETGNTDRPFLGKHAGRQLPAGSSGKGRETNFGGSGSDITG